MGADTFEWLTLLLALLPGFLTGEIICALTTRQKHAPLDRIVQALLYTLLDHVTWIALGNMIARALPGSAPGEHYIWSPAEYLVGLCACAVGWGLLVTLIINTGFLHAGLRRIGLTRRTSRPSEWYDAFYRAPQYIVVHLKDGRRILGWPKLWPERPGQGHIFLTHARWLDTEKASRLSSILIRVDDVRFVEFVPAEMEKSNGQEQRAEAQSRDGP